MRPHVAPPGVPDGPVRVEFQVRFSRGPRGRRRVRDAPEALEETPAPQTKTDAVLKPAAIDPNRVPQITKLLVLGYHFERLVREGAVKDYAEIARLTGLSRSRMTQLTNLTRLSPAIQESILTVSESRSSRLLPREPQIRSVTAETNWDRQASLARRLAIY